MITIFLGGNLGILERGGGELLPLKYHRVNPEFLQKFIHSANIKFHIICDSSCQIPLLVLINNWDFIPGVNMCELTIECGLNPVCSSTGYVYKTGKVCENVSFNFVWQCQPLELQRMLVFLGQLRRSKNINDEKKMLTESHACFEK